MRACAHGPASGEASVAARASGDGQESGCGGAGCGCGDVGSDYGDAGCGCDGAASDFAAVGCGCGCGCGDGANDSFAVVSDCGEVSGYGDGAIDYAYAGTGFACIISTESSLLPVSFLLNLFLIFFLSIRLLNVCCVILKNV